MNGQKNFWKIIVSMAIVISVGIIVIYVLLSEIDATLRVGIIGVVIGVLIGLLTTAINAFGGMWNKARDVENKERDRLMHTVLELTKMELAQRYCESKGEKEKLLTPEQVYRKVYKNLLSELDPVSSYRKKEEKKEEE